jgi:predicted RNA binding protein YcfA (HicA-like mRNA interferase family)
VKLPRDLSGSDLAGVLCRDFGYRKVHQEGSHLILQAESPSHRISIPQHRVLRPATLNAILKAVAASRGISKDDILDRL